MSREASKLRAGKRELVKRGGSTEAIPAQGFQSGTLNTRWRNSCLVCFQGNGGELLSDWELSVGEERNNL